MKTVACLLLLISSFLPILADAENLCGIADIAIEQASTIRELKLLRPVPCRVDSKDDVRRYMLATIDEKLTPEKLKHEEILFKALGFIPEQFEYKDRIIELYLSQIAGYYDPQREYFAMAGWMPGVLQAPIAVHELTHALQDQHFDLDRLIDIATLESDSIFARSALVEGDAMAVQTDYTRRLMGQEPLVSLSSVDSILAQNVVGAALLAKSHETPRAITLMMIFPYTSGLRFVHHLLRNGGYQRVSKAYLAPPRTSEEILHPEKYFQPIKDFEEILVEQVLGGGKLDGSVLYEDVLGEFSLSLFLDSLGLAGEEAASAAAGWGGDRALLIQVDKGYEVRWLIRWDALQEAEEFMQACRIALKNNRREEQDLWYKIDQQRHLQVSQAGLDVRVRVLLKGEQ